MFSVEANLHNKFENFMNTSSLEALDFFINASVEKLQEVYNHPGILAALYHDYVWDTRWISCIGFDIDQGIYAYYKDEGPEHSNHDKYTEEFVNWLFSPRDSSSWCEAFKEGWATYGDPVMKRLYETALQNRQGEQICEVAD